MCGSEPMSVPKLWHFSLKEGLSSPSVFPNPSGRAHSGDHVGLFPTPPLSDTPQHTSYWFVSHHTHQVTFGHFPKSRWHSTPVQSQQQQRNNLPVSANSYLLLVARLHSSSPGEVPVSSAFARSRKLKCRKDMLPLVC